MEGAAYLTGQILKVSDELHAMYCRVERDGNIPSRLSGNLLFTVALTAPEQALAQLGQRMVPYIAWAQSGTNDTKDEGGKPHRYYTLYETFMSRLSGVLTRMTRFDDFDKAQLFIGYLAAFPKNEECPVVSGKGS